MYLPKNLRRDFHLLHEINLNPRQKIILKEDIIQNYHIYNNYCYSD